MRNLFFALAPDPATRARLHDAAAALQRAHRPGGRAVAPAKYHLTLLFIGDRDRLADDAAALARAAGARVRVPPFALAIDRAGSFPNRRVPWWLGCGAPVPALEALAEALDAAMAASGYEVRRDAPFAAHLTILRDADRALPVTPIAPIEWPVERFALMESRAGADAYAVVEEWRLSR